LVGAGLFVRSLRAVRQLNLGFDAAKLIQVGVNFRGVNLTKPEQRALWDRLTERAAELPGVASASRAATIPFRMTWSEALYVAGIDSVPKLGEFDLQAGSTDYFATAGTRLLRGRGFEPSDVAGGAKVVVVSEAMARALWPNEDAIGKCIRVGADTAPCRAVVGVAENIKAQDLRSDPGLMYYMPIDQFRPQAGGIFVRTRGDAKGVSETVRRELQRLVPGAAYVTVLPMGDIVDEVTRAWRLGAMMFSVFGLLALTLASIGLYSVIAYNVTQRTHEMGVRVALGAQARDVIRLVVTEGVEIVMAGVAVGSAIALVASRFIAPLLFEVSPKDPPVFIGVVLTLLVVAAVASMLPAWRAARVDPNVALRAD
ncbi:MAG TPA: FtsX-like permease family protein, partial [Gemmatimonadaceae bacterium]